MASQRTRRIFQAAIDVFSEYGFEKATMDEIAARAKVAKGTVYYHFKSKEDLFVFLVEEGAQLLHEQVLSRIPDAAHAEERLRVAIREQLRFFMENRDFCIIIFREAWGEDSRQREFRRMLVHFVQSLREIIEAGSEAGQLLVEAPDAIAWSIFGGVSNTALHYLFMDREYDLLRLAPQLEVSLLRGFVAHQAELPAP